MTVVGFGRYAQPQFDLGIQEDVNIPRSIMPIPATCSPHGENTIRATIDPPQVGDLRIIMQQHSSDGGILRSWKGGPPNGTNMGKVFVIRVFQGGQAVPVDIGYDKVIWSGLSWAVGEVKRGSLSAGKPVVIEISSAEDGEVSLEGRLYAVEYSSQ
jgi:hypothetical protein